MPTAVVILPSTTYRATDFVKAAESLGVDLIVASENPPPLDMGDRYLQIDCSDPDGASEAIIALGDRMEIDGVVAADDAGVVVAALASEKLGLLGNGPEPAAATRDKGAQRNLLGIAEISQPRFSELSPNTPPADAVIGLTFPVVIKPLDRSAGQGVIRADNIEELEVRTKEVRGIVGADAPLLIEEFISGDEIALEGIVTGGELTTLAIFDKPGASEGPVFQEAILVTPSRLSPDRQAESERVASSALRAIGIEHGPVHVEMKVDQDRVSIIEVAARSIGGLCSQSLNFGLMGTSLETLILRNTLGLDKPELKREPIATGVLMIPIPRGGVFGQVSNIDALREIPGVTGIDITVTPGNRIDPPPVGDRYLGFVFARADSPEEVTKSLISARDLVEVEIS